MKNVQRKCDAVSLKTPPKEKIIPENGVRFFFFFLWIIRARYFIKEGKRCPREYTGRKQRKGSDR